MGMDQRLLDFVIQSLLRTWKISGVDVSRGCFRERLDPSLQPLHLGYERLVTQARLIFAFSEGSLLGAGQYASEQALTAFRFMCEHYWDNKQTGWRFSIGEGGSLPGSSRDLYAHGFVLLACASLFRATKHAEALEWAERTFEFIQTHFRHPQVGFFSVLDADNKPIDYPLLQNPHMHLFEGLLFLNECSPDERYATCGEEILDLLLERMLDRDTGTLTEYFDRRWYPDLQNGDRLEPGHHFEWVWLLHRWILTAPEPARVAREKSLLAAADKLLQWALHNGIDQIHGGIFDEVDRNRHVLKDSKRIWPTTEALKALRFASMRVPDAHLDTCYDGICELLLSRYFHIDSGTWTESLSRDLLPEVTYLPGTTLYHIVMAVRELQWLEDYKQSASVSPITTFAK